MNRVKTPFEEGYEVGSRRGGTWFDCPYSGFDAVGALKKREWLRGFDAARAAGRRHD